MDLFARITLAAVFGFIALGNLQHITAARLASALFLTLIIILTLIRLKAISKAGGIAPRAMALAGSFGALALSFLPHHDSVAVDTISAALVVTGSLLAVYVVAYLGRSFSINAEARKLVVSGPYRWVRHPLYLCEEIAIVGIFVSVASPFALVILLIHGACQWRRMLNEERILAATFPEFKFYARRTPMVLPL